MLSIAVPRTVLTHFPSELTRTNSSVSAVDVPGSALWSAGIASVHLDRKSKQASFPKLQIRKPRVREIKYLLQGYKTGRCQHTGLFVFRSWVPSKCLLGFLLPLFKWDLENKKTKSLWMLWPFNSPGVQRKGRKERKKERKGSLHSPSPDTAILSGAWQGLTRAGHT